MMAKARYESKKAKAAESTEAQERRTNVADLSARAGAEQPVESSTMGASRGGGVPPDSGNPSSISNGAAETPGSDARFWIQEEFEFLRSKLAPFPRSESQQRTELASGSDETTVDAPQTPLANPYPEFTPCPQEASPGPRSDEWVLPGATRGKHPSPLPTLEEIIQVANAEQDDVEAGLRFPTHYYHGMSPPPPGFHLPAHYPSSSTDSALLQMHLVFRHARDPIRNPHDAEQLLRDMGVWPVSKSN